MINKTLEFLVTYILVVPKAHLLKPITIFNIGEYNVVSQDEPYFSNNKKSFTLLSREIDHVFSYEYQVAFDVDDYIYKTEYRNFVEISLEGIGLEWSDDPFNLSDKVYLQKIRS